MKEYCWLCVTDDLGELLLAECKLQTYLKENPIKQGASPRGPRPKLVEVRKHLTAALDRGNLKVSMQVWMGSWASGCLCVLHLVYIVLVLDFQQSLICHEFKVKSSVCVEYQICISGMTFGAFWIPSFGCVLDLALPQSFLKRYNTMILQLLTFFLSLLFLLLLLLTFPSLKSDYLQEASLLMAKLCYVEGEYRDALGNMDAPWLGQRSPFFFHTALLTSALVCSQGTMAGWVWTSYSWQERLSTGCP